MIEKQPSGTEGFGYDPVFKPSGSSKTFAEMTLAEKSAFSHRKKATDKLVLYLQQQQGR
jgi:XTP/dITP diphosphohydrolase